MKAYRVHIEGQVQGVGFRPYVHRLATELGLKGWVSNGTDGVHIEIEGEDRSVKMFVQAVVRNAPQSARITRQSTFESPVKNHQSFNIRESSKQGDPDLLITPDLAMCPDCKQEISAADDRRYQYAFTTCTNCGPRYSIITNLPYDRTATTMQPFGMCEDCYHEYETSTNRRFYSQTNSCPACAITLSLCEANGKVITQESKEVIERTALLLAKGKIIALKGIGGYLLLCNATNEKTVQLLRTRKHRPTKPFALLYPSLSAVRADAFVSAAEEEKLTSSEAPIVLLTTKPSPKIALSAIAPNLTEIGVMLPYTPLLQLVAQAFNQPLVATSGNQSGSPIFYEDEKAFQYLEKIADYFVTNDRDIVVPQDDSVVRFTNENQPIVLRRSRGLAPTFLPHPFKGGEQGWLAMGGDLKSAFALLHHTNAYVSQYLGDLENFETQQSFEHTLEHWQHLLKIKPRQIIIDRHPNYFSSALGKKLGLQWGVPVVALQHHRAHFYAVLAENDLLATDKPVLGVVWDGTGWGEDGSMWGGEFFVYENGGMERVLHLDYFQHLMGDKMAKEPRLSALALCKNIVGTDELLRPKFTLAEWTLYKKMMAQNSPVRTSSIGRLFDGVASMLGLCDKSSYEGEAALYLEALASKATEENELPRSRWMGGKDLSLQAAMSQLVDEIKFGTPKEIIAYHFHKSLVNWIAKVASRQNIHHLAFSGGVFQNALLVHLIQQQLGDRYELYFHQQLSPNDECLSVGQLAWWHQQNQVKQKTTSANYALHLN